MLLRGLRLACAALCVVLIGAAVRAQPATGSPPETRDSPERARALELGSQGLSLYNEQHWAEAYERFERAEALVHSPVFVLYMGRAKREMKELVAARALFERAAVQPTAPDEPASWQSARSEAKSELEALSPLIPSVRIVVASAGPAKVWLDGAPLAPERVGQPVEVDPGEHEAVARMASGDVVRQRFSIRTGERNLRIELVWPPRRPPPSAPAIEPRRAADPDRGAGYRSAGVALIVIGSLLGAVGIGTGIGALAKDGELEDACPNNVCTSDYRDEIETYYGLGHTATVTLSVGAAALTAGILLRVLAPSPTPHADARLVLAPGFVGVAGRY